MFEIKKGSIVNYNGYNWEIEGIIYGNDNIIKLVRLDVDNGNKKVFTDMFIHEYYQLQWDKLYERVSIAREECEDGFVQADDELDDVLHTMWLLKKGKM